LVPELAALVVSVVNPEIPVSRSTSIVVSKSRGEIHRPYTASGVGLFFCAKRRNQRGDFLLPGASLSVCRFEFKNTREQIGVLLFEPFKAREHRGDVETAMCPVLSRVLSRASRPLLTHHDGV
jgi:hypothetical protein